MNTEEKEYCMRYSFPKQENRIAEIINTVLDRYHIDDLQRFQSSDIIYDEDSKFIKLVKKQKENLYRYVNSFSKSIKNELGLYYHFLSYEQLVDHLDNKSIQLSSLNYYYKSDPFEYDAFIKRYSNIEGLNYKGIKDIKDRYYIFCLTSNYKNRKMMAKYDIVIGLRFFNFAETKYIDDYYYLNEVYYDSGYDFEFLNEIQYYLKSEFDKTLFYFDFNPFSIFYKRPQFKYENEIRLCIDFQIFDTRKNHYNKWGKTLPKQLDLANKFCIYYDKANDRKYIKFPFEKDLNNFFEMQITDIIINKDLSTEQINKLNSLKNNDTLIWKQK